jgi:hypothetical protein
MPPISCSHHTSISRRAEIATMMSNVPAKIRKKLNTAASAANVLPGWIKATTPAAMKTMAASAWSSFHQPAARNSTPISSTPAAIATKPNKREIADTDL